MVIVSAVGLPPLRGDRLGKPTRKNQQEKTKKKKPTRKNPNMPKANEA
jgi:hypothetical protein